MESSFVTISKEQEVHPKAPIATLERIIDQLEGNVLEYDPVAEAEVYGVSSRFLDRASGLFEPCPINSYSRSSLLAAHHRSLRELHRIDLATLSPQDHLLYRRFEWSVKDTIDTLVSDTARFRPIDHTSWSTVPSFLRDARGDGRFRFRKEPGEVARFYLQMKALPEWADQALDRMGAGIKEGEAQPQIIMRQVARQLEAFLANDTSTMKALMNPIEQAGEYGRGSAEAYEKAAREQVIPTLVNILQFTKDNDTKFRKDDEIGLCHLPAGETQFLRRLEHYSTLEAFDPHEFHRKIKVRFDQRVAELTEIQQGFKEFADRPLKDFLEYANYHAWPGKPTIASLKKGYHDIDSFVQQNLGRLFNRIPTAPFEIGVDQTIVAETAFPFYTWPTVDNNGTGTFIVPIADPKRHVRPNMLRIYLHEGRAGHHQQIALQQNLSYLPSYFRHQLTCLGFIEGWAKYAETFTTDLHIEEDIWQYIRRLTIELHELRMVLLDFGVNYEGWSLEKAQEEQKRLHDGDIKEILRVIVWPGQSIVYPLGLDSFLGMRKYAEQTLGSKFNLPRFHDALLENGSMPLSICEEVMKAWVDAEARQYYGRL